MKRVMESRVRFRFPGSRNPDAPIDYGDQDVRINRPLYVEGDPVADFIVAQGTTGMWSWRKWYGGVAECWGYTAQDLSGSTQNGSVYVKSGGSIALPGGLFMTGQPVPSVSCYGPAYCHATVHEISRSAISLYFITLWSSTEQPLVFLRIIGNWK